MPYNTFLKVFSVHCLTTLSLTKPQCTTYAYAQQKMARTREIGGKLETKWRRRDEIRGTNCIVIIS